MSMNYVICVRDVKKQEFIPEPGKTRFLFVPEGVDPKPEHEQKRDVWVRTVMEEAETDRDAEDRPVGDVLVFIHGYNNGPTEIMKRHLLLKEGLEQLGYRGAVVSFDWPSAQSALNYLEDRSDAKKTALKLVDDCISLFSRIQAEDCRINVHLLAHSTGAFVVREAFDDADDRASISAASWTVSQIMFIGGDVSAGSMSATNATSDSLYRHCVRLTNYSNAYDAVLKLSNVKRAGTAPRVGRIGLPQDAPSSSVNVDCSEYFNALKESDSTFVGTFCHSWHIGNPTFTRDLLYTLEGNLDRAKIPTRTHGSAGRLILQNL